MSGQLIDKDILQDMLVTEKFISNAYDMGVMEATNPTVRQSLQHIQKEEQEHAKMIFDAMHKRGWYKVQPAQKS